MKLMMYKVTYHRAEDKDFQYAMFTQKSHADAFAGLIANDTTFICVNVWAWETTIED